MACMCVFILGPFSDEEEVEVEEKEKCLSGSEVEGVKDGDVEIKDIEAELDEVKSLKCMIWLYGMSKLKCMYLCRENEVKGRKV